MDSLNDLPKQTGWRHIVSAGRYSRDGLLAAWQNEAAFRQLVYLHSVLFLVMMCLNFGLNTRLILMALSFLSLIVELINTAIEAAIDRISLDIHPLSKRAKDAGSAAQLLALILLALAWLMALC